MGRKKELIVDVNRLRATINRKNKELMEYKKANDIRTASQDVLLEKTGGFDQQWLVQKFGPLFERRVKVHNVNGVKTEVGTNYFRSLTEYKSQFNESSQKEAIEKYNEAVKELAQYIGVDVRELEKGDIKSVNQLSKWLQEVRGYEVNVTFADDEEGAVTTRTWTSEQWKEVDEFKQHLTSDDAITLEYAIQKKDYDKIMYFINNDNNSGLKEKIGKIIDIEEDLFGE
jgi:hypothetical protein